MSVFLLVIILKMRSKRNAKKQKNCVDKEKTL